MAVSLKKGGMVNLSKRAPGLTRVAVGLGWDLSGAGQANFDLDAVVFLTGTEGKVLSDAHFVFFNNLKSPCGAVQHMGDNRTGMGEGDDEVVNVLLSTVAPDVSRVVIGASIHEGDARRQNFEMVDNAYMRVVNLDNGEELARYDLAEKGGSATGMIFGELLRDGSEWQFKAVGEGTVDGLYGLCTAHGVNVG